MVEAAKNFRNAVQLGERLLCDLREFETSGRSEWTEDILKILCKDGKTEFIHRFIFRSASPVFARILSESPSAGSVSLDIQSDILRIIIDFIYSTQNLSFSTSQSVELFAAASRFEIGGLATSIGEAVDMGFSNSSEDGHDSLERVPDSDIERAIELFNRIKMGTDQGNRLLREVRAWVGTDKDRSPAFTKLFDALSQLDLEERPIAESPRISDNPVISLWGWLNHGSRCELCSLRICENGELSLYRTGKELPISREDANDTVVSGDLLIRKNPLCMQALRLDPQSPVGYAELNTLPGYFRGLRSTPDGGIFAWDHRAISWIAFHDGLLTKAYFGKALSSIRSVHFIEGNSDRAPYLAQVGQNLHKPHEYLIEFIDCHTREIKSSRLPVPELVLAVSSDEAVLVDGQNVYLITHNFEEVLDRRFLVKSKNITAAKIIGRSKVLLLMRISPSDGTASVALFYGMEKRSEIRLYCEDLKFSSIISNPAKNVNFPSFCNKVLPRPIPLGLPSPLAIRFTL